MPPLEEVLHYLKGVGLLLRLDAGGLRWFDLSERGLRRSFWSMAWCFPLMIPNWIWWHDLFRMYGAQGPDAGFLFYLRMAISEYLLWMLPLLTAGIFMVLGGLGRSFDAMVIVCNWFNLPVYLVTAVLSLFELLVPAPFSLWYSLERMLAVAVILGQFCIFFVIARKNWLNALGMSIAAVIPAVAVSVWLYAYLGISAGS